MNSSTLNDRPNLHHLSLASYVQDLIQAPITPITISTISALLASAQPTISLLGTRTFIAPNPLLPHGAAPLVPLAKFFIKVCQNRDRVSSSSGIKDENDDNDDPTEDLLDRLLYDTTWTKFVSLYAASSALVSKSTLYSILVSIREFHLGCEHCAGTPRAVFSDPDAFLPGGFFTFSPEKFQRLWPDEKKTKPRWRSVGMDGKETWEADREMVKEVVGEEWAAEEEKERMFSLGEEKV